MLEKLSNGVKENVDLSMLLAKFSHIHLRRISPLEQPVSIRHMKFKNPYEKAYQIAIEDLSRRDLEEVAFNSSVQLEGETFILPALGETYRIVASRQRRISPTAEGESRPKGRKVGGDPVESLQTPKAFGEERGRKITQLSNGSDPKIAEKIILLHYLITADGTALRGEDISFENIPGAGFYYPTFKARTINQLTSTFQNDLARFIKIGLQSGGKLLEREPNETNPNRVRMKFFVLPNVPINFIYWRGEEELPPALQILFDTSITHYLPLEDIVVVTELLTHRLIRASRAQNS